jgi:hypothetical protein
MEDAQVRVWNWFALGITVVAVVMIIGFTMYVADLMDTIGQLSTELAGLHRAQDSLITRLIELRNDSLRQRELLDVLSGRRIETASMRGDSMSSAGYGKVVWDRDRGTAVLSVSNLPATPVNMHYQLWVISNSRSVSAGVFSMEEPGSGFFKLEHLPVADPGRISGFLVTLEPKDNVHHPGNDVYLIGSPD